MQTGDAYPTTATLPTARDAVARFAFLDVLRGIAALVVFGYHASFWLLPDAQAQLYTAFNVGNFGIVLFFLCSGFVIPAALERQGSLRRFWIRRVGRLYPLYWLSIAGTLGLSLVGLGPVPNAWQSMPPAGILTNILMLQAFFGYRHLLGLYWTLVYELIFYVLVSLLFHFGVLGRTVANAVAVILLTLFSVEVLPRTIGLLFPPQLFVYLATMFVGALLCRGAAGQIGRWPLLGVLVLALVMLMRSGAPDARNAWLAAYALFVLVLLGRKLPWPRPLVYLGEISYSVYLLHLFVIYLVPLQPSGWATFGLWTLCVLAVALLTYRWIERPGIALGRRAEQWAVRRTVRFSAVTGLQAGRTDKLS